MEVLTGVVGLVAGWCLGILYSRYRTSRKAGTERIAAIVAAIKG